MYEGLYCLDKAGSSEHPLLCFQCNSYVYWTVRVEKKSYIGLKGVQGEYTHSLLNSD